MAVDQVYMEVPAVRGMAKNFGTISDVLNGVDKALEVLSSLLKASAFVGLVGGAAVAQFIDGIRPDIHKMSQKCTELNSDLSASVDAFERGDEQGATRFY